MNDFLTAIGLVLVIEGVLYGGFPGLARRMAAQAAETQEEKLRAAGVAAIAFGFALVWLVRG